MFGNKQKKNIMFYCPFINRGGIETTLIKYSNFLSNYYSVSIFTNSFSKTVLSKINKNVKIMNIKNKLYLHNRILNDLMVYKYLKKDLTKSSIIFSLQDHFLILILNFLFSKNKIIIRTSSMIPNSKNFSEQKHLKNIFIKKLFLGLYRLADQVITFSKNNVRALGNKGIKSVCIYNYFEKKKLLIPKLIKNLIYFILDDLPLIKILNFF